MKVEFDCVDDVLVATVHGEYEGEQAVKLFRDGLKECRERELGKMLVDIRQFIQAQFATEKALYAMQIAGLYDEHFKQTGKKLRIAYLAKLEDVSTFEPGLDHVRSLGLSIELFTDESAANSWLGETEMEVN